MARLRSGRHGPGVGHRRAARARLQPRPGGARAERRSPGAGTSPRRAPADTRGPAPRACSVDGQDPRTPERSRGRPCADGGRPRAAAGACPRHASRFRSSLAVGRRTVRTARHPASELHHWAAARRGWQSGLPKSSMVFFSGSNDRPTRRSGRSSTGLSPCWFRTARPNRRHCSACSPASKCSSRYPSWSTWRSKGSTSRHRRP